VTPRGSVRALSLETGALAWQRDLLASHIVTYGQELFATTFAQTCIGLDAKGRTLWTYEYGWGREPALLPTGEWLVLHYGDGKRVKLNRELMKVTGRDQDLKFRDFRAREEAKDWKGALSGLGRILDLEPGNGEAWRQRSALLRQTGAPRQEQLQALVQASRSLSTPHWTGGPALRGLAAGLGANWVWKRQYGPKFYPTLVPHKEFSFYLENDNQTLVLINHETGDLINSFHFSEELDMKVGLWKGDTILVSSPSRLYMLSPLLNPGGVGQHPLRNPVCQAQAVPGGVVFSDWYGGLSLLGLPDRTLRWEKQLGRSGLLVGKSKQADYLDVIDLEGNFFAIHPVSGKELWSLRLPPGTVTESFSTKDRIFAGYNQGTLIGIDRAKRTVAWTKDFGEQIFSLSGNRENTLVLTTASKKLICLNADDGAVLSQVRIQSYLFNRPTVTDQGYWLGTTEPALEKRNFNHDLLFKYKLPDLPGSPILFGNSIFIGTLDNFILSFPS
jgi:outer membrane protein assembly factor BamB